MDLHTVNLKSANDINSAYERAIEYFSGRTPFSGSTYYIKLIEIAVDTDGELVARFEANN